MTYPMGKCIVGIFYETDPGERRTEGTEDENASLSGEDGVDSVEKEDKIEEKQKEKFRKSTGKRKESNKEEKLEGSGDRKGQALRGGIT